MKLCPEISFFTSVREVTPPGMTLRDESGSTLEWRNNERDHKTYAHLSQHLISTDGSKNCISHSIGASSTDDVIDKGIKNTLEPDEENNFDPYYWSSCGSADPNAPESLTYRLSDDLVFVDEFRIQPLRG